MSLDNDQDVVVLFISFPQGESCDVFDNVEDAQIALFGYVEESWADWADGTMPTDPEDAIEAYFDASDSDWYYLQPHQIQGGN